MMGWVELYVLVAVGGFIGGLMVWDLVQTYRGKRP